MEGFASWCYNGDKKMALECLEKAMKENAFDVDEFINAIYDAANEDRDPKVRETLVAVCDAAPRWLIEKLELDTSSFLRGEGWCWTPISAAYKRYIKNRREYRPPVK